ncbi:MAG: YbaK/EbsC family protein [Bacteroidota bacterium]|nr:YbaK/EbsC family protein [Bacteroidota bacterium]
MSKIVYPVTTAIRFLREKKIEFIPHVYDYEEHGGTHRASNELRVDEHAVIKTLVMETDPRNQFLILMHGDCEVSAKQFARLLNVKQVVPSNEATANRVTGYQVGGISPFGTRTPLLVYAEKTIFDLTKILINGGKRGFLVEINPHDMQTALLVHLVEVGISSEK